MLRDQPRRSEEPSVPFVGQKSRTGSGIMLQPLLLRLPRLQERVGNAVTFPTRYRGSHSSIPLGNGEGVPVSGTYAPATGTHRSNRHTRGHTRGHTPRNTAHRSRRLRLFLLLLLTLRLSSSAPRQLHDTQPDQPLRLDLGRLSSHVSHSRTHCGCPVETCRPGVALSCLAARRF
jgi:hypothetical protein